MTYFFEEITEIKEITLFIESNCDDDHEKCELIDIVKETIHHKVLDSILDLLDQDQKEELLLLHYNKAENKTIVEKAKEWVAELEDVVKEKVREYEQELIASIREEN